jgi:hypothetical protein
MIQFVLESSSHNAAVILEIKIRSRDRTRSKYSTVARFQKAQEELVISTYATQAGDNPGVSVLVQEPPEPSEPSEPSKIQ